MHLTRLTLTDFRGYTAVDVSLGPGMSAFTGANGAGKTNLAEAACYAATLTSHRVSTDAPLIREGADRAIIRAVVRTGWRSADPGEGAGPTGTRDTLIEMEINTGRPNRYRVNRAPAQRRQVVGVFRCVMFAPEDLPIVKGDPDQRRRYLDDLLVLRRPRYAGTRADYERIVRQRSALLKTAKARGGAPAELQVWDDQLVAAGAELTVGRLELVREIEPLVGHAYVAVAGGQTRPGLRYRAAFGTAEDPPPDIAKVAVALREALERRRVAELERAVCLVGPHRDELELRIGELPARGYASHGESWSLALGLRLAAFELLRSEGEDPVLVLDDVFAELDSGRRERLAELVAGAEQLLVTAAVEADIPARLAGARFTVANGSIR